jgi:D-3-phosphoglycerate dehydrogenase
MSHTQSKPNAFHVGLTDDGIYVNVMDTPSARQPLEQSPHIEISRFPADETLVKPQLLDQFDAVLAGGQHFTRESCQGIERCAIIVRFGAGYDRVDIEACTEAGIIVSNTPNGIRRSMSITALTHILALTTRFVEKTRLLHNGQWSAAQQSDFRGMGLSGRTVGYIGFGNIGSDLHRLLLPFDVRHLVYDP